MSFDVALGAGKAATGVVKPKFTHVDKLMKTEPLCGDVLWRNESGGMDGTFAQGGQSRRRAADRNHSEVTIGIEAALFEDKADDAVLLRTDSRHADFLAFEIGDGFDVRRRKDAPVERVNTAGEINRIGAADGRRHIAAPPMKLNGTWPETIAVVRIGLPWI